MRISEVLWARFNFWAGYVFTLTDERHYNKVPCPLKFLDLFCVFFRVVKHRCLMAATQRLHFGWYPSEIASQEREKNDCLLYTLIQFARLLLPCVHMQLRRICYCQVYLERGTTCTMSKLSQNIYTTKCFLPTSFHFWRINIYIECTHGGSRKFAKTRFPRGLVGIKHEHHCSIARGMQ